MSRHSRRASHVARGRRHQGRQNQWDKKNAEALRRDQEAREREARERALTDAQRELRAEQKRHRELAVAGREQAQEERRRREVLILELERIVEARERELSEYAGVMVTIPKPEPARQIRRKPEDQAVTWSKAPRSPDRRSLAQIRKLNGLD